MNTDKIKAFLAKQPEYHSLFGELNSLWHVLRRYINGEFKRTLPFGDYVVDRWEKAHALGFGSGTSIYDSALVLGNVQVGEHTWIGPGTVLDGLGNLKIGSYCDISAGVQIYSHDTVQRCISRGEKPVEYEPTIIGDYCYIGPNTVIAKGVTIGDGCIIGSNSLVLKSIPPNSKAFGTPCKVVAELEAMDRG